MRNFENSPDTHVTIKKTNIPNIESTIAWVDAIVESHDLERIHARITPMLDYREDKDTARTYSYDLEISGDQKIEEVANEI